MRAWSARAARARVQARAYSSRGRVAGAYKRGGREGGGGHTCQCVRGGPPGWMCAPWAYAFTHTRAYTNACTRLFTWSGAPARLLLLRQLKGGMGGRRTSTMHIMAITFPAKRNVETKHAQHKGGPALHTPRTTPWLTGWRRRTHSLSGIERAYLLPRS